MVLSNTQNQMILQDHASVTSSHPATPCFWSSLVYYTSHPQNLSLKMITNLITAGLSTSRTQKRSFQTLCWEPSLYSCQKQVLGPQDQESVCQQTWSYWTRRWPRGCRTQGYGNHTISATNLHWWCIWCRLRRIGWIRRFFWGLAFRRLF